ncbi:hypothetical protein TNCV_2242801 [Trichonephila clavipes]|nr:hypothetical protein TNCV_2242801 [Trichonephila clavipes]
MLSSRPIYQQDNARPHTARLLQGYDVTMACQVTRSFVVWTRWEGNCSRRDTGENCAMQRLWQDLGGHK